MSKKLIYILLAALVALMPMSSALAQGRSPGGDPPPISVTDKTEVLSSKTEKVANSITTDGGSCDRITNLIKVTPMKGEPMILTETITLCPNSKHARMSLPQGRVIVSGGADQITQWAPGPSYTCGYGQGMGSGWTTNTRATVWLWYSYYNQTTGSYGTISSSISGMTVDPSTFTNNMSGQYKIRYYAATLQTSPAAIQSGNGTWCG